MLATLLRRTVCLGAAVSWLGSPVLSQEYQLVQGDRIALGYTLQGAETEMTVDIDGQLRIAGSGAVDVAGLTLDEVEQRITDRIKETGLYLNPIVSIQMLEYAPITVAGDVTRPGQYAYVPGMTVGAALAQSGGSQASGVSRFEVERAEVENEGFLQSLNLEIAGDVVRIARLTALLDGTDTYAVSDALLSRVPLRNQVPLTDLQDVERNLFENTQTLVTSTLMAWDNEIALIEEQLALLDQRIGVQEQILERTSQELETAESLAERGLQTAARFNAVQQRDDDAKARALELESARLNAVQAIAEARRSRTSFAQRRREDWLAALQTARLSLNSNEIAYARRLKHQSLLTGDAIGAAELSEALTRDISIVSPREGRRNVEGVSLESPILPGDLLVISVGVGLESGQ